MEMKTVSLYQCTGPDAGGCFQVMIAESYGGKDEPVDTLVGSFVDISVQVTTDPLRIKEKPNEKTYQVN